MVEHNAALASPLRAGHEDKRLFWAHITAFGALWGVMEITLGSFLHALRLPFAGVILASLSAALLVAQRQVISLPGVSLMTGLIAALCKSISPGGIILGPIVGITIEALLVETALLLGPRRVTPALLAGALAALWALLQTLLTKLIYYGMELLELYLALLERAGTWLGLTPEQGWSALLFLMGSVALMGMGMALLGRAVGRAALHEPVKCGTQASLRNLEPQRLSTENLDQSRARKWMALLALGTIALQVTARLHLAALALALWLGALAFADRRALQRLWLPRFWSVTLLFALGSGWLLGKPDIHWGALSFSSVGLHAGALMVLRGAFVFGLMAWASRALARRDIESVAARLGLPHLGAAMPTALALLPELEQRYQHTRQVAREQGFVRLALLREMAIALVRETAHLALTMTRSEPQRVFIVGARGAGKSTRLAQLATALRDKGLRVGGVLQPAGERDEHGKAQGYDLLDLKTQQTRPFARCSAAGYAFEAEGWAWARERIEEARREADVLIVDELGRLEADGAGHLKGLRSPLPKQRAQLWLLGVRWDREVAVAAQLGAPVLRVVLPNETPNIEEFIEKLWALMGKHDKPR
ncbi:MAG: DUF2478 domain-containing protein [Deltaproteobacteria bacterium]|nr:DUF2478 domain-containing protein [Deltaproteobacteria bacterium]